MLLSCRGPGGIRGAPRLSTGIVLGSLAAALVLAVATGRAQTVVQGAGSQGLGYGTGLGPSLAQTQQYLGIGQTAAPAGDSTRPKFVLTPNLSLQETFTDNVNDSSTARQSDWYTDATAGFDASLNTEKTQLTANYSASGDVYVRNSQLDGYVQNFLAVGHSDPIENHLSVDFRGSLDQTPISQFGAVSPLQRTVPTNQTQTLNLGVTPRYSQRLGNWGVAAVEYSLNRIMYIQPSVGNNNGAPGDGNSHEISATLSNGSMFTSLIWQLMVDGTYSQGTGSNLADRNAQAHAEYRINRSIGVPVTVGYDDYTGGGSGFASNTISGVYWEGGLHLTPGPRTDLTVTFGRRDNAADWNGDFIYRVTPSVNFRASYQTVLETQQQALSSGLNSLTLDSTGNIVSPFSGNVLSQPGSLSAALTNSPFLEHQFQFGVEDTRGRNSYSMTGGISDQSFGGVQPDQNSEQIALEYTRQLNPAATLTLTLQPTRSTQGPGTQETLLESMIEYNYKFSEKTTFSAQVLRQRQYGTTNIIEDDVLLTLSRTF